MIVSISPSKRALSFFYSFALALVAQFFLASFSFADDDVFVNEEVSAFTITENIWHTNFSVPTVVGYDFEVVSPIEITELGIFDQNGNGVLDNPATSKVTLWNSKKEELVSAVIPLSTSADEGFFYVEIPPVVLEPGKYTLGTLNSPGGEEFSYYATVNSSPEVTLSWARYIFSPSVTFPSHYFGAYGSFFGANFKYKKGVVLTVSSPVSPAIYQRGMKEIPIKGTAPENVVIQARGTKIEGGTSTSWVTVAETDSEGNYSGTLDLEPGWYDISVRGVYQGEFIGNKVIPKIGVGDIYLMAGQSNSSNYGQFAQSPSDERVLNLSLNGIWQPANDPQPRADGGGGSPWPAMGDMLASNLDIPIGVVSTGQGGTTVWQWDYFLYSYRLAPAIEAIEPYGFKAVLWHQGEWDSLSRTSTLTYKDQLGSVIDKSRVDAGFEVPWYIAIASHTPWTTLAIEANIVAAQRQLTVEKPSVFQGANTDDFFANGIGGLSHDGLHFSSSGLKKHGEEWANILSVN